MTNNINKQRIVVNKYTDNKDDITSGSFYSGYGEIILSIKEGEEGIYIKNDKDDVINLNNNEKLIEDILIRKSNELGFAKHQDLTLEQYNELIKRGSITIDGKTITYDDNTYYMIYEN